MLLASIRTGHRASVDYDAYQAASGGDRDDEEESDQDVNDNDEEVRVFGVLHQTPLLGSGRATRWC